MKSVDLFEILKVRIFKTYNFTNLGSKHMFDELWLRVDMFALTPRPRDVDVV